MHRSKPPEQIDPNTRRPLPYSPRQLYQARTSSSSHTPAPAALQLHSPSPDPTILHVATEDDIGDKKKEAVNDEEREEEEKRDIMQQLSNAYVSVLGSIFAAIIVVSGMVIVMTPATSSYTVTFGHMVGLFLVWLFCLWMTRMYLECVSDTGRESCIPANCRRVWSVVFWVGYFVAFLYLSWWAPQSTCVSLTELSDTVTNHDSCPWYIPNAKSVQCMSAEFSLRLTKPCASPVPLNTDVCIEWRSTNATTNEELSTVDDGGSGGTTDCLDGHQKSFQNQSKFGAKWSTTPMGTIKILWYSPISETNGNGTVALTDPNHIPVIHFRQNALYCGWIARPLCFVPLVPPPFVRRAPDGSSITIDLHGNTWKDVADFILQFIHYLSIVCLWAVFRIVLFLRKRCCPRCGPPGGWKFQIQTPTSSVTTSFH